MGITRTWRHLGLQLSMVRMIPGLKSKFPSLNSLTSFHIVSWLKLLLFQLRGCAVSKEFRSRFSVDKNKAMHIIPNVTRDHFGKKLGIIFHCNIDKGRPSISPLLTPCFHRQQAPTPVNQILSTLERMRISSTTTKSQCMKDSNVKTTSPITRLVS